MELACYCVKWIPSPPGRLLRLNPWSLLLVCKLIRMIVIVRSSAFLLVWERGTCHDHTQLNGWIRFFSSLYGFWYLFLFLFFFRLRPLWLCKLLYLLIQHCNFVPICSRQFFLETNKDFFVLVKLFTWLLLK